jgi:hypothetical protein
MTPFTTRFHCTNDFAVLVFLSFVHMLFFFLPFFLVSYEPTCDYPVFSLYYVT